MCCLLSCVLHSGITSSDASSCFASCCRYTNSFTHPLISSLTDNSSISVHLSDDTVLSTWRCSTLLVLFCCDLFWISLFMHCFDQVLVCSVSLWYWTLSIVREGKYMYSYCMEKLLSKEVKCQEVNLKVKNPRKRQVIRVPTELIFLMSCFFTCKLSMKGWNIFMIFCITLCCLTLSLRNTKTSTSGGISS